MSTQPAPRRIDPLPMVAAILAAAGTGLLMTGIWMNVYSAEGGGSATPYGLRNNEGFGGLVTNSWIYLLIAGILGALAIAPLVVALVSRRKGRPVLSIGLVVLLAAAVLGIIVTIAFITDRDALEGVGVDLSLSVAFYLVLGGVVAWILATVLTVIALVIPSKPPVPIGDGRASAWPSTPPREPLLSSPPPPPSSPSPSRIASPYPTAPQEPARPAAPADEGATRVFGSEGPSVCRSCGASVDPGAKFCSSCGAEQPPPVPTCASCGAVANEADRFCRQCGGQVRPAV